jgi:hypothetical protein
VKSKYFIYYYLPTKNLFLCKNNEITIYKQKWSSYLVTSYLYSRGVPRGDAQDARASPLPPPVHPPPAMCIPPPPPQPEWLVMRKDEAVGNKKKKPVCLRIRLRIRIFTVFILSSQTYKDAITVYGVNI